METNADFIKGYNDGYILRKNHPLLIKKLVNSFKSKNIYLEGLEAGVKQCEKELSPKLKKFRKERSKGKNEGLGI